VRPDRRVERSHACAESPSVGHEPSPPHDERRVREGSRRVESSEKTLALAIGCGLSFRHVNFVAQQLYIIGLRWAHFEQTIPKPFFKEIGRREGPTYLGGQNAPAPNCIAKRAEQAYPSRFTSITNTLTHHTSPAYTFRQ
jgi:hypothetical protein